MNESECLSSNLIRDLLCSEKPLSSIINELPATPWKQVMQVCREILSGGEKRENQLIQRKLIAQEVLHPNEYPTTDLKLDESIKDKVETIIERLKSTGLDDSAIENICCKSNFDAQVPEPRLPTPQSDDEETDPAAIPDVRNGHLLRKWTPEEDQMLLKLTMDQNLDWDEILPILKHRTKSACETRLRRISHGTGNQPESNQMEAQSNGQRKFWTKEEDQLLWELRAEKELPWDQILPQFNNRTKNGLQNRFARLSRKKSQVPSSNNVPQEQPTKEKSSTSNQKVAQPVFTASRGLKWTPEDEELLWESKVEQNLEWEEIYSYFPQRTKMAIQTRYHELKAGKFHTTFGPKASLKSKKAPHNQKQGKVSTPKHTKPHVHVPAEEEKLRDCIENDLTISNLASCFPDYDMNDLYPRIENHPDFVKESLTRGEKMLLTEQVRMHCAVEDVCSDYPLRSKSYIDMRYKEIAYASSRKNKFKTLQERLLYEAGMACIGSGSSRRSTRRSAGSDVDFDKLEELEQEASKIERAPKPKIDPEVAAARAKARAEAQERKRAEKLLQRELAKARRLANPEAYAKKASSPLVSVNLLKQLSESAEYFQTVAGDRQKLQDGAKRKRTQTVIFSPPVEVKLKTRARQAKKWELKRKLREESRKSKKSVPRKRRKLSKKGRRGFDDEYEEFSDFDLQSTEPDSQAEEEEDHISPFDPPDINADTLVPLNNRRLFFKSLYEEPENFTLPELSFRHLQEGETSKQAMTNDDGTILYDDELAADVVGSHRRCYRDMPISFPQYSTTTVTSTDGDTNINYANSVKIRFFLYPQHCESFVLAEPKDNELDPVHEIIKVFMIHYALYFDYSESIKNYINELCHKLELAVEANDFSEFIYVIDTWNTLMLELSPNEEAVAKIVENGDDINAGAKSLLYETELRQVKSEDLNLEMFYNEICFESISPVYEPVQGEVETIEDDEEADISIGKIEPPQNSSPSETQTKCTKPLHYKHDLFKRLREKTSLSRYAIQQILVRVYARVVSTDSRKLRSYKAFTAEVYGELLPSFTSEVLEKVQLKPTQKFYDLGSGVGNTTLQAALEFGACCSGGCEIMDHASKLTTLQEHLIQKHLAVFGLSPLNLKFALKQSFVNNEQVRQDCLASDVLIINNYLFDGELNDAVGKLLYGIKPGTKIISLRNFISPRYRATFDTAFDFFSVEKHEMSDIMSVSWTANKVPYYISTVEETIRPEYLGRDELLGELMLHASMLSKSATPSLGGVSETTGGDNHEEEEDEGSESVNGMDVDRAGNGGGVIGTGGESTPPTDHNSEPENDKSIS
ncbi:DOT1 [Candida metapsilosis]|uniref:Histone-lysine N-methyltransferase, H3 lysine-79 specific n=1 Tax=Candida metapsilosis TaxID=273372 RepID=A0A8H7ZIL6_9ASCO|nr:DOT1 [Candida metapsilosis]